MELLSVHSAKWEKEKATAGEKIKWSAKIDGYKDQTPAYCSIFKRDLTGPDIQVFGFDTHVRGDKVEGEWVYVVETAGKDADKDKKQKATKVVEPNPYSAPEYYFEVTVGNSRSRSGLLGLKAKAEVKFLDHEGKPLSNVKYKARTASGEIRTGTLDGQGKATLENISPGEFSLMFDKRSTYKKLSRKSK